MAAITDYFPFNLVSLGGLSGVNTAQSQSSLIPLPPLPLFGTWPFSGQQQEQEGMIATLPFPVDSNAFQSQSVPNGLPLLPPVSDGPNALVDTMDIILAAPETAMNTAVNAMSQGQQQSSNSLSSVATALRTMTKTIALAPETVRQDYTGQASLPTQEAQQQEQEQQSQEGNVFQ